MTKDSLSQLLNKIFLGADIKINGSRKWDLIVNSPNFYKRVFRDGQIGLGEGYMLGEWDSKDIVELLAKFSKGGINTKLITDPLLIIKILKDRLSKRVRVLLNRDSQARELADTHYNLPYELYEAFLDKRMLYTCGYWENAANLDEAQEAKLEITAKKLKLKSGMKVLDIGLGWGGLSIYLAQNYGVEVTGITIAEDQLAAAEKKRLTLPKEIANKIKFRLQDYRDVKDGPYDRIVVMGMIEHITHNNFRNLMDTVHHNLTSDGLFLLHTIGTDNTDSADTKGNWIEKYIFPGSEIPNSADLVKSYQDLFVMEDWHNFGAYYERTCIEWFKKFDKSWKKIKPIVEKFEPDTNKFYRMWKLYLLGCAGSFRARSLQLWQIVLSKDGIANGYKSVR